MALLNGQTPEEIASEAIEQVTEDVLVTINGTFNQKLESLTRYQNRDIIQMRSEKWYESHKDELKQNVIEKLITDKFKAVTDYMTKKENDAKMTYFLMLRSKGISLEEAEKLSGINQVSAS